MSVDNSSVFTAHVILLTCRFSLWLINLLRQSSLKIPDHFYLLFIFLTKFPPTQINLVLHYCKFLLLTSNESFKTVYNTTRYNDCIPLPNDLLYHSHTIGRTVILPIKCIFRLFSGILSRQLGRLRRLRQLCQLRRLHWPRLKLCRIPMTEQTAPNANVGAVGTEFFVPVAILKQQQYSYNNVITIARKMIKTAFALHPTNLYSVSIVLLTMINIFRRANSVDVVTCKNEGIWYKKVVQKVWISLEEWV